MGIQEVLVVLPSLVGVVIATTILYSILSRKREKISESFTLVILSTIIWSIGYIIEILTPSYSWKILAAKSEYMGIAYPARSMVCIFFTLHKAFPQNYRDKIHLFTLPDPIHYNIPCIHKRVSPSCMEEYTTFWDRYFKSDHTRVWDLVLDSYNLLICGFSDR